MTGTVFYIVAISFQLTGAIFLISNFLPSKSQIIHETAEDEATLHWGEIKENGQTEITYSAEELNKERWLFHVTSLTEFCIRKRAPKRLCKRE